MLGEVQGLAWLVQKLAEDLRACDRDKYNLDSVLKSLDNYARLPEDKWFAVWFPRRVFGLTG